ncbi:MAG: hypothetical protein NT049_17915 [Planctomycetota bacterium]|nr:hypothetical protein [Planctomycetota bacterium]
MGEHWFWWLMTAACMVWYSTITVYVAIRGAFDIRGMLRRLSATNELAESGADLPRQKDDPQ